jgi:hypothetical protein
MKMEKNRTREEWERLLLDAPPEAELPKIMLELLRALDKKMVTKRRSEGNEEKTTRAS